MTVAESRGMKVTVAEPRGMKVTVARVLSRNFGLGGSVDTCIIFGSFHVIFC